MIGQPRHGRREIIGGWVVVATWVYTALILAVLVLIRRVGERWFPVIPLIFMPKWLLLLPVPALALAAGRSHHRRLWVLHGAIALLIVGPVMSISLPVGRLQSRNPVGLRLRIMTLNRGTDGIDANKLIELIEREHIQLICFQEGKSDPTLKRYWKRGWTRTDYIASRLPVVTESGPLRSDDDCPYPSWRTRMEWVRVRAGSGTEFSVASVHLDTVRHGLEMFTAGDLEGMKRHTAWRESEVNRMVATLSDRRRLPVLVGGDLNLPSDVPSFAPVRERFRVSFDQAGWGYGYTYPSRLPWIRIDHILASPEWSIVRCWVGPDLGSDHLPLIAEVVLSEPPPAVTRNNPATRMGSGTNDPVSRHGSTPRTPVRPTARR
jgi:endonuclease/exonuclease/phosphatase family metal-dependent hydrolase